MKTGVSIEELAEDHSVAENVYRALWHSLDQFCASQSVLTPNEQFNPGGGATGDVLDNLIDQQRVPRKRIPITDNTRLLHAFFTRERDPRISPPLIPKTPPPIPPQP